MASVTIQEAQAKLAELIHGLRAGGEVVITENDQPIAKLVTTPSSTGQRPGPGLCREMLTIVANDDEHLQDFAEYLP